MLNSLGGKLRGLVNRVRPVLSQSDLREITCTCSGLSKNDLHATKQKRISVTSSTSGSNPPPSSNDDLSTRTSSATSLFSHFEHDTPNNDDCEDHSKNCNSNFSNNMIQADVKPFSYLMSDRSDSDGQQAHDQRQVIGPQRLTVNPYHDDDNDNDDAASVRTLTKSVIGHSIEYHQQALSHGDDESGELRAVTEMHHAKDDHEYNGGDDKPVEIREVTEMHNGGYNEREMLSKGDKEPEGLLEFRKVHNKITRKYRVAQ